MKWKNKQGEIIAHGGDRSEAAARNGKRVGQPLRGKERRQVVSYTLPPELVAQTRTAATAQGVTASQLVEAALLAYIAAADLARD